MNLKKLKSIKPMYLVFTLAIGIVLMILSNTFTQSPPKTKSEKEETPAPFNFDAEEKLRDILESIEGVSNVKIFINYENNGTKNLAFFGEETSSADGDKKNSTTKKQPVTVVDGGGENPFVNEEVLPKVRGVIITARGIKTKELEVEITEAVSAVLGVPVHRVKILSN